MTILGIGYIIYCKYILRKIVALASVAQLVGVLSHRLRRDGLVPGQGAYPGFGFDPQSGHVQEGSQLMFLSSLSLLSSPAKSNEKLV